MTRRDMLKASALAGAMNLSAAKVADTHGFKLGIITDELTGDVAAAADFIASYGLRLCELREVFDRNIMNLSQEELERTRKILTDHKLQVTDIASPAFKWNLPQMPAQAGEARDEFKASFTEADADTVLEKAFRL